MQRGIIVGALAWIALAGSLASAQSTPAFTIADYSVGSVGSTPVALASGDFNADTFLDLAVVNNEAGNVSILYGSVNGTFTDSGISLQVGSAPSAIAVGDFNGDGKPDLAITDEIDYTVSILLNQGVDATTQQVVFSTPVVGNAAGALEGVVIGDVNGDQIPDIAAVDYYNDQVAIFLGQCTGNVGACDTFTLQAGQAVPVGAAPGSLVAVDLDGDHKLDLVVANSSGGPDSAGTLTVLKGVGNGTFIAEPEIASASFYVPTAIVTSDFNGDGIPDIAVANEQGFTVTVLLGDGIGDCDGNGVVTPDELITMVNIASGNQLVSACAPGDADKSGDITIDEIIRAVNRALNGITFQILAPALPVGHFPSGIVAADFNGDGKVDIATSNTSDDSISVLAGVGDGTFSPKVDFSLIIQPDHLLVGPLGLIADDFNGDHQVDIASANQDDDSVSVLLNAAAALK